MNTVRPSAPRAAALPAAPALATRTAVAMFLAFALAYFFSALVRSSVATLAPVFSAEFGLGAADLGLLAGAYFLGFAALQLPLGTWLDRHGAKRVLLPLLGLAALGCAAFAAARGLPGLVLGRAAIGFGVGACLMAPMLAYRRWFSPGAQLRSNSWMLMTGSMGMLASTLPVQWLLPALGWRGIFVGLAVAFALCIVVIAAWVPADPPPATGTAARSAGYAGVWRSPVFRSMAPLAFFMWGGLMAVQTLWVGPWLTQVRGQTPLQAATGLLVLNACMLVSFLAWGMVAPRLVKAHWLPPAVMARGLPLALAVLLANVALGPAAGAPAWVLFCVSCTFLSMSQPYVGQQVPPELAGRAVSGFNLLIFTGTFFLQWAMGLAIDGFEALGASRVNAFRGAFALLAAGCIASYAWFIATSPPGSLRGGRTAAAGSAHTG